MGFQLAGAEEWMKVFVSGGVSGVGVVEVANTASKGKMDFVKQYGTYEVVDYRTAKGLAVSAFPCTGDCDMEAQIMKESGKARRMIPMSEASPCDMLVLFI